jgi:hypothetical protein
MRKTIILAIATTFLAGITVVTGLVRTVHGPIITFSATPMVDPQAIGSLAARVFNVI